VKTTLEKKSDTQVLIHVELPPKVIDQKLKQLFKEVARTIDVPGFRRGKVPRRFLEDRFGQDFLYEDAQSQLMEEYVPKAIEEEGVEPASRPNADVIEFDEAVGFKFDIEVDVFPDVNLPEDLGVEVEAPEKNEIGDDMIDEAIENLKADHATLVPKAEGESSEPDDVVVIRDDQDRTQEVQARDEGWMAALVGVNVGDEVELKPSEEQSINVTIESIKVIELPEVDEVAEALGHDDEEALRAEIAKNLNERADNDYEQALKVAILDKLVEESAVVIPEGIVDELMKQELNYHEQSGHVPTDGEKDKMKESLEMRLKRDRLLQAIREREGLEYSDEEFEKFINEEAEKREQNPVKFKALLERERQLARIRSDQETQKVLDYLQEKATVK